MINEVPRLWKQKNDGDADGGEVSGNDNGAGRREDERRREEELTGVMKEAGTTKKNKTKEDEQWQLQRLKVTLTTSLSSTIRL